MQTLPLTQPVEIFLLVLLLILGAPLIFARLKIPNIVGLILSGVIVGPFGFNLLDRDASFTIFGQVGILYLMFVAAIEIDMYHLKKNLRRGVIFGLITFLIPMTVGLFVTRYAFSSGWGTAVLISSMYASHTLISYPIISRFGLANNRGAVIAVCGTIVTVLLSLLALAEVVTVRQTGTFSLVKMLMMFLYMGVYATLVGYLFPKVTRWFFRKINDSVAQFIFILALVCLSSLCAKLMGLEAILGAFYAGLVLNRFIPNRSALMRNIEFVGNAIFIPYFLIGVGMLINVHVVFHGWGVPYVAGVMIATAIGTKWLSAFTAQRIFRLDENERVLMFGLSSGKAAATIAATMIGYEYGLLNEDQMNGAVIMILLCCVVASVVTERSAKRIRLQLTEEELQSDAAKSPGFARQIVAVANPLTSEGLMKLAVFMRNPRNREPITALYVRNNDDRRAVAMGQSAMNNAAKAALSMGIPVDEVERYDLNIVAGVTNTLREKKATDIIIGLHRKSTIIDSFYGFMTEGLIKATDRMIILTRCFIPVDTVRKLVVVVPHNAQYETGFHSWVARIGNLAMQLGCRVVFITYPETEAYLEAFITEEGLTFSRDYRHMESWDDFIILSSQAGEEDLLVVIGARKGSLSYSSDLEMMPGYLGKYFVRHNIVMIYPSQFGK